MIITPNVIGIIVTYLLTYLSSHSRIMYRCRHYQVVVGWPQWQLDVVLDSADTRGRHQLRAGQAPTDQYHNAFTGVFHSRWHQATWGELFCVYHTLSCVLEILSYVVLHSLYCTLFQCKYMCATVCEKLNDDDECWCYGSYVCACAYTDKILIFKIDRNNFSILICSFIMWKY